MYSTNALRSARYLSLYRTSPCSKQIINVRLFSSIKEGSLSVSKIKEVLPESRNPVKRYTGVAILLHRKDFFDASNVYLVTNNCD